MPRRASEEEINVYYEHHFPRDAFCALLSRKWLGGCQLHRREIALDLHNGAFLRTQSVSSPHELLRLFRSKRPAKVHTGAVFSDNPSFKKRGVYVQPTHRELVFDIDINDYAAYGVDADDLDACNAAWPLVAFGLHVVKLVLKRHFGFANGIVVYSGRRGAHLTIFDKRACELSDEARSAIVAMLQPGGSAEKPHFDPLVRAPCFARIFKENVLVFFESTCILPRREGGLGVLDTERDRQDFLEIFTYREKVRPLRVSGMNPSEAWWCIKEYVRDARFSDSAERAFKRAVLTYTWPRLDANVSKQTNHLLKAMFSVHPKTGLVCVPVGNVATFKPERCPSVAGLVAGDEAETTAFDAAVKQVSCLVDKITFSASEKWERRIKDAPPCLFRMPSTLASRKRSRADDPDANEWMYADRTRICYTLNRVFVAIASDGDPGKVQVAFSTEFGDADDSTQLVYPGYAPPSRATSQFPVDCFLEAAAEAARKPGQNVVCTRAFVCALLHHRRTDRPAAVERLAEMRAGLEKLNFLCDLDTRKGRGEQRSMLCCQARSVWDVQHVFLC
tara:strand:+ start:8146 stop:9828 length:1683 start_codon:yes stop_codon:yes gene_type:complete